MRTKLIATLLMLLMSPVGQAMACAVCFGAPQSKSAQSMATAIWFMMGAIMAVFGGVAAMTFRIWKHSRMPLEPHQELVQEDFKKYD
jgi:heme/copper-type cytochrome/quinol oxidase subunit 2